MKAISLITATPPSFNPGMLTCEATGKWFLSSKGFFESSKFFRIQSLSDRIKVCDFEMQSVIQSNCEHGIKYNLLTNPDQLHGTIPLFWGDFLHMHLYIKTIKPTWAKDKSDIRKILLLEGASPEIMKNTISYATSILFNTTADYYSKEYGDSLYSFVSNIHHIQMRDAISATIVGSMRPEIENCMGIDAAQLLSLDECAQDILGIPLYNIAKSSPKRALIFFARGKHSEDLVRPFIDELLIAINLKAEWLAWGDRISFPYMEEAWYDLSQTPQKSDLKQSDLKNILSTVVAASVVITDTYHLCAISWALGIPAVLISGIYHEQEIQGKGLNIRVRNDKRKVLMGQDGLLDFYIEPHLMIEVGTRNKIVERLRRAIVDDSFALHFRKLLAVKTRKSEKALLNAINELCT